MLTSECLLKWLYSRTLKSILYFDNIKKGQSVAQRGQYMRKETQSHVSVVNTPIFCFEGRDWSIILELQAQFEALKMLFYAFSPLGTTGGYQSSP